MVETTETISQLNYTALMPHAAESPNTREHLVDMIAELYPDAGWPIPNQILREIAHRLSRLAGRKKPWTHSYLRLVINGNSPPGKELRETIGHWGAILDGTPEALVGKRLVRVFAAEGVREGTVVTGHRHFRCHGPGCTVWILTDHPTKLYCSDVCSRNARNLRRRQQRAEKRQMIE